ncbi:TIGR04376 family protein [Spirulina subsalsa FACHB-351]|uniref:TIGR04376 family protein n=1 Tax=Spirulina subsalsa FACHB-351 TaxID=234711 RepID=A0ABT3L9R9_9CYAN|nr:TIGR04376 family protein [Spirulina subsalsa]MCW6037720.1 TIGR04376 family protein [Spirulina subsalsa FACHB-351]
MSIFDDVSRFLESQLDEFLKNNPHLELQAIEEQLREQEIKTQRLISDLKSQQQQLQDQILAIAEDIKRWHERIAKAQAAGRLDLAQSAQEREAALLRQGNQLWGQRASVSQNLTKAEELLQQTRHKRQEVQAELKKAPQTPSNNSSTSGWNQGTSYTRPPQGLDPVEDRFREWEIEEELNKLKRNL